MKRSLCVPFVLWFFCFSGTCVAAVFERDWQMPGDGLLTYDDVNRREWLELTETRLTGPCNPSNPQSCIENPFYNVALETLPGGSLEGFHIAAQDDVYSLAESAGIDTSTLDYATNQTAAAELSSLIGITFVYANGRQTSWGVLDEVSPETGWRVSAAVVHWTSNEAGMFIHSDEPAVVGVWLYRIVPEPSTITLSFIMVVLLAARRARSGTG